METPKFTWCKEFPVETPYVSTPRSVGADMFVPEFSKAFFDKLADVNGFIVEEKENGILFLHSKYTERVKQLQTERDTVVETYRKSSAEIEPEKLQAEIAGVEQRYNNAIGLTKHDMCVAVYDKEKNTLYVKKLCVIPSGILIDLPEDYWFDIRRKSSSNRSGRIVQLGTVDEDYTYNIGIEIEPVERFTPLISGEKLAQIVFFKKVMTFADGEEQSYDDFVNSETVRNKRQDRTGGWGSTGTTK